MNDPEETSPPPDEPSGSTYSSLAALFGKPPGALKNAPNRPTSFSPFVPLMIVFLSLTLLQVFSLKGLIDQRQTLLRHERALNQDLPQATAIADTVENLGRDLVSLSAKSAEARKIVTEFNIQLNQPAR
jgi:hypothetical protein